MSDIREELEKKIPDLTDAEWRFLEKKGHVGDMEVAGDAGLDDAVREVTELRAWQRDESVAAKASSSVVEQSHDPAELARRAARRSEALGALIAADAGRREEVAQLRREMLRGRLLKPERVGEWLKRRSQEEGAIQHLTLRLPLLESERDIIDRVESGPTGLPEGHPVVARSRPQVEYVAYGENGRVVASVSSTAELEPLRLLSELLAADYSWMPAQATEFLLTGLAPTGGSSVRVRTAEVFQGQRLRGSVRAVPAQTRIELEIDPTLTPEEVKRHYATARRELLGGRRTRRMSPKHLRLAVFADAHQDGTWRERMNIWNVEAPEFRYSAPENFQRDAVAARRRLLDPLG